MNICESLTRTAKIFPNNDAIVFEGQRFTYARLNALSIATAECLRAAGINAGDRVAIMLPNTPAFAVWYYGALRIGAITVSISTRLTAPEVAFMASDCGAKVIVATPPSIKEINGRLPETVDSVISTSEMGDTADDKPLDSTASSATPWHDAEPNDAAVILYTSGTTGEPKGATLSHNNVRTNVAAFNHLCEMKTDDRILLAVPLFHCFGQNALLNSALNVGATLIFQRSFDLNESKRLIAEHQVTQLYGVPMMFQLFCDRCEPADLASVRYCFSAAATLPTQVSQRWLAKFDLPLHEGYGLTETSPFASYNHRNRYVLGSIGEPIDAVEMKIVDSETGEQRSLGEPGEIAIRGPNVMLGYWNRPDETAQAIRDGWFYSGDIGHVDESGFFYISDRVKDMIAVGGLKVYPAEIEKALLDHPAVAEAAVVGLADDLFGEHVVAFVVLNDIDASETRSAIQAIGQHCKSNLANYKTPRHIIAIDKLPRNPSGKVLKTKLRETKLPTSTPKSDAAETASQPAQPIDAPPSAEVVARHELRPASLRKQLQTTYESNRLRVAESFVQHLVQELSDSDEIPEPEATFLSSGLDSLSVVELSGQIQVEIGGDTELPATLVFDYPRICDLAAFLVASLTDAAPETKPTPATSSPDTGSASSSSEVTGMSEDEALQALMKELED